MLFLIVWLVFGVIALGPPAFIYIYMKRSSRRLWPTKVDGNYKPKVSIIVPTYNESRIINFKLANLSRLSYPENLQETIFVDSNSSDGTAKIIQKFCGGIPQTNIKLLVEDERKGKSHALNYALEHCSGDIIIVSDADCFWPSNILEKAMPFLADPTVGVIGGPKILLNSNQTWVTRMESDYLESANLLRLGESKAGSSLFFEGGFCAFKRAAIERFDPYRTGSDDCGTVLGAIERDYRAMLVPEARFYSTFPASLRNKLSLKQRRINQLLRVFAKYFELLFNGKIKLTKVTVVPNTLLYLFSPIAFLFFFALTIVLLFNFPYVSLVLLFLLLPKVRFYAYQIVENNFLLAGGLIGVIGGKSFSIWNQPEDRLSLTRELLAKLNLI